MRLFFPTVLLAAIGLLVFPQLSGAAIPQEPEEEISDEEYAETRQELVDARLQLELSHLRMAAILTDHNYSRLSAEAEVTASNAALVEFSEYEADLESEMMAMDVAQTQDGLADAQEELAQLTFMYERNALADATAQVVLERAARSIERQKSELALVQKRFQGWSAFGKNAQRQELSDNSRLAQASFEAAVASQELELAEFKIEIDELKKSIKELESELQESESTTESDG